MQWAGKDGELAVVSRDDDGKSIYYDFETCQVHSEEWVAGMAHGLRKRGQTENEHAESLERDQRKMLGGFYVYISRDLVYLVHPRLVADRPHTADSDGGQSEVTMRFEDAPYAKDAVAYFKSKSPILCYECHGLTFVAGCQVYTIASMLHACIRQAFYQPQKLSLIPMCQSGDVVLCRLRNTDVERPYVCPSRESDQDGDGRHLISSEGRPKSSIANVLKHLASLPQRRPWRHEKAQPNSNGKDKMQTSAGGPPGVPLRGKVGNRLFEIEVLGDDCEDTAMGSLDHAKGDDLPDGGAGACTLYILCPFLSLQRLGPLRAPTLLATEAAATCN